MSSYDSDDASDGTEAEIHLNFDPGPIGINANWETGVVTYVENGGQASRQGVQPLWVLLAVDGKPYSETLLDEKRKGTESYTISFGETEEFQPSCFRSCSQGACFCKGPFAEAAAEAPCCKALAQCWLDLRSVWRCWEAAASRPELECATYCVFCCGFCAPARRLVSYWERAPRISYYRHIPAECPESPVDFLYYLAVHCLRASAMSHLNTADIVSSPERAFLRKVGMLKIPQLKEPRALPIINMIVWRRSTLYVLLVLDIVLVGISLFDVFTSREDAVELNAKIPGDLPSFSDWKDSADGREAAPFEKYVQDAAALLLRRLSAEIWWYFVIEKTVELLMRTTMMIPLFMAASTWPRWGRSYWWLKIGWVTSFAVPFVICTVPIQTLIDFHGTVGVDLKTLQTETRVHYNLDGGLLSTLEMADHLCQGAQLEKLQHGLVGALELGAEAHQQLPALCGLVQRLDDSWFISHFTTWGRDAHVAHLICRDILTSVSQIDEIAPERHVDAGKALALTRQNVRKVCGDVSKIRTALSSQLPSDGLQREGLKDMTWFMADDGVAGLTESLYMVLGVVNACTSFKVLLPIALSLGPGLIKGAMRAKCLVPEASLPGAYIIVLPWIYAPLNWALFNMLAQLVGNWSLLLGLASLSFYPLFISIAGMLLHVGTPQKMDQVIETYTIFRRIEIVAVIAGIIFFGMSIHWMYEKLQRAQEKYYILRVVVSAVVAQLAEMQDFIVQRYLNMDMLQWILMHPRNTTSAVLGLLDPVFSFAQKLILTSVLSMDWMFSRVAHERQFEYLVIDHRSLPYHATQADLEDLFNGRRQRLDDLVLAFGGRVAADNKAAREMHGKK